MNIDSNLINNGAEAAKNLSKIVANLTDKPAPKVEEKKPDQNNQPHNQTVEVKVGGDGGGYSGPKVIREKSETHVHKVYPEARALTEQECEVERLRIKTEHELKMREHEFRMQIEEYNRRERKEREEYERRERERRREREKKFSRNMCIGLGIAGAVAIGCIAADFYTNSRNAANRRVALQQPENIQTEGTVS